MVSSQAWITLRSSALSRTMAAYFMTLAAVGVTSISSRMYCWELSGRYTPRTFISSRTVTGSMGLAKVNI